MNDDRRYSRAAWLRALERSARIERHPTDALPVVIERVAGADPGAVAIASPESTLRYRDLTARCNAYARWGLRIGLRPGEVAALMMPNRAEYLAVWLGLTRIGVIVALLNPQWRGEGLAYAARLVAPKLVICDVSVAAEVRALCDGIAIPLGGFVIGGCEADLYPLEPGLAAAGGEALRAQECARPSLDDTALYLYTSGTTGWPKAARISHYRILQWSEWFAGLMDTGPADRLYDCLPLYHSVGGIVAPGAVLVAGGALVLRPRFSAQDFWDDLRRERCTLVQYIGELCRYLLATPHQAGEDRHALRMICGNGLRAEVWEPFKARFRIPRILEYYAATEGNFSLFNVEGEPGSIGRIPAFLAHRMPVELLRFDAERGEPRRTESGRCERAAPDEPGEAVGRLPSTPAARSGRFEGYVDAVETERKILRDVFTPGDAWVRTGDLLRRDPRGFYYFVDRIGDTYRWKGENVSCSEVAAAIGRAPGVVDAVVYGVPVPGADGRAGMVALLITPLFDLADLHAFLAAHLPSYARPVFVRLVESVETTATFKPRKQALQEEGYDPATVGACVYVDDRRAGNYVPIDAALFARIAAGRLRL